MLHFLIRFCSRQLTKIRIKDSKYGASQQMFNPSYFVMALGMDFFRVDSRLRGEIVII